MNSEYNKCNQYGTSGERFHMQMNIVKGSMLGVSNK